MSDPTTSANQAKLLGDAGYSTASARSAKKLHGEWTDTDGLAQTQPSRGASVRPLLLSIMALMVLLVPARIWLIDSNSTVAKPLNQDAPASPARQPTAGLVASGYVSPLRSATVSADEIGRVTAVYVKTGQRVTAGQVVAKLDDERQLIAESRAKRAVAVAESQEAESTISLRQTEASYDRAKRLEPSGAVSRASMEDLELQRRELLAKLETSQHYKALAVADLESAKTSLRYRLIRAPFAGVVAQINAQVGEIVSPTSAGSTFTRSGICTLIDRSTLYAVVEVDEALLRSVTDRSILNVEIPALKRRYKGRFDTNAYEIDKAKGTGVLKIAIVDFDDDVLPNMQARVTFQGSN